MAEEAGKGAEAAGIECVAVDPADFTELLVRPLSLVERARRGEGPRPWHLLASIVWTIAILVFGLFYFRKTERRFADIA